jgi:hypothetical protein
VIVAAGRFFFLCLSEGLRAITSHGKDGGDCHGIQHHDAHERTASECIAGSILRIFSFRALQLSLNPVSYGRVVCASEAKHFGTKRGRKDGVRDCISCVRRGHEIRIRLENTPFSAGR